MTNTITAAQAAEIESRDRVLESIERRLVFEPELNCKKLSFKQLTRARCKRETINVYLNETHVANLGYDTESGRVICWTWPEGVNYIRYVSVEDDYEALKCADPLLIALCVYDVLMHNQKKSSKELEQITSLLGV